MGNDMKELKASSHFLNLLLDNIDSAILIVDDQMEIHQFNNSFLDLFDCTPECILDRSFGRVSGCINAVKADSGCGNTSRCRRCEVRGLILDTRPETEPPKTQHIEHIFYIHGSPVLKHLSIRTRPIHFRGRNMILVIIRDVSENEQYKKELEERQAEIEQELQAAADLQKSLLPDAQIDIPNTCAAWRFEPCHHVGGDLFQIYQDSDDTVSTYALDVCGHGIHSAFVAVTVSQFLSSLHNRMRLTGKRFPPEKVMNRLDRAFPMDRFDCFFSIAYATLNIRTGRLVYSNAGHMPPLILRADGRLDILQPHDTVIGAGFEGSFGQYEETLKKGDRFILYTDGLVENYGRDGERFGKYKFYAAIKEMYRLCLPDLVKGVFDRSSSLRSGMPPTDDMSLVAIEFTP